MTEKRIGYAVRLAPDLAREFKIALAMRNEKAQDVLFQFVQRYITDTKDLEKRGHLTI